MGSDHESRRYRQFLKHESDEIFASDGWKVLSLDEAEKAVAEGRKVHGVYDPAFESNMGHLDGRTSARIVTAYDGKLDKPSGHKDLKSIVFYLDETVPTNSAG